MNACLRCKLSVVLFTLAAAWLSGASFRSNVAAAREPIELSGHEGFVCAISFSPSSDTVATFYRGELRLWKTSSDSESTRLISIVKIPDSRAYDDNFRKSNICWSPDGKQIAVPVAKRDSSAPPFVGVQVWDIAKKEPIASLPGIDHGGAHGYFLFTPKGDELVVALRRKIEIWSPTNDTVEVIESPDGLQSLVIQHMHVVDEGKGVITARADGEISYWDLAKRKPTKKLHLPTSLYRIGPNGSEGSIVFHSLVTAPDGKRVAVNDGLDAGSLSIWDIAGKKPIRKLIKTRPKYSLRQLSWSGDGKWLAGSLLGQKSDQIVVWDASTTKEVAKTDIPKDMRFLEALAFSGDARYLAAAVMTKDNYRALLWDVSDVTGDKATKDKPSMDKPSK